MSEQSNLLIREMPSTMLPGDALAPLESVLCTEELHRRPSRPPDYETENRALATLVQGLAESPRTILRTLADTILKVFHADSAGLSLVTEDGKKFYWPAIAGEWRPHVGGGTPRDFGPCGDVLDRNAPQLFRHPERRYLYLLPATPPAEEALLVPFYVHGKAVGTIWIIAHDDRRRFDAEDLRQLEGLGRFASAAYRAAKLSQSQDDARRAALNLMEDAVVSRETVETLNVQLREGEERLSTELDATRQLQDISLQLLHERGNEALYDKIIVAAASIMRSDYASVQMFHPERGSAGELRLLAFRGFNPEAANFWEWVRADSGCTCGMAMRTGQRVIAANVETCDFVADTAHRATYLQAGIYAAQSTPLVSRSGHLLGMISTHWRRPHNPSESDLRRLDVLARQAADLIERAHAEAALRQSEERFRALVDASAQIVWTANADGAVVEDSPTWRAFTGQTYEQWKDFGWLDAVHPDDHGRIAPAWRDAGGRNATIEVDYRIRHVCGEWRWTTARATPVFAADGSLKAYVGMNIDITERKRHEEQRELLIGELNHRVKNTLATVQALAMQTLRNAKTIAEGRESFEKRLMALSRAHDVLTRERWEGADLNQVVADAIAAYSGSHQSRFQVAGPMVRLQPKAVLALSMALHELATNAVKYGALSNQAGRVDLTWGLTSGRPRRFHLRWTESGGPPVVPPKKRGFGSRLIEQGLMQDLAGEVRMNFEKRGLVCTIDAPLDEIAGGVG